YMRTRTDMTITAAPPNCIIDADCATDPPDFAPPEHQPVLLREALEFLNCMPGRVYVDATLGLGGHASGILDLIEPDGLLIAVDRDKESLQRAVARLRSNSVSVCYYHENFKN